MTEFRIARGPCEDLHSYLGRLRGYALNGIDEPQYNKLTLDGRVTEVLDWLAESMQRAGVPEILGIDTITVPGPEGER